jgi:hypothetical protein
MIQIFIFDLDPFQSFAHLLDTVQPTGVFRRYQSDCIFAFPINARAFHGGDDLFQIIPEQTELVKVYEQIDHYFRIAQIGGVSFTNSPGNEFKVLQQHQSALLHILILFIGLHRTSSDTETPYTADLVCFAALTTFFKGATDLCGSLPRPESAPCLSLPPDPGTRFVGRDPVESERDRPTQKLNLIASSS